MRSLNRVVLLGRLVAAPDCRNADASPVCHFQVETVEIWMGRNGEQRRVTIHDCTAFGQAAQAVHAAEVGEPLYVEGALRRRPKNEHEVEVVCFVAVPLRAQPQALASAAPESTS